MPVLLIVIFGYVLKFFLFTLRYIDYVVFSFIPILIIQAITKSEESFPPWHPAFIILLMLATAVVWWCLNHFVTPFGFPIFMVLGALLAGYVIGEFVAELFSLDKIWRVVAIIAGFVVSLVPRLQNLDFSEFTHRTSHVPANEDAVLVNPDELAGYVQELEQREEILRLREENLSLREQQQKQDSE